MRELTHAHRPWGKQHELHTDGEGLFGERKAHLIIGDVVLGSIRLTSFWAGGQECLPTMLPACNLAALHTELTWGSASWGDQQGYVGYHRRRDNSQ